MLVTFVPSATHQTFYFEQSLHKIVAQGIDMTA